MDPHVSALLCVTAFCLFIGLGGGLVGREQKRRRDIREQLEDAALARAVAAQEVAKLFVHAVRRRKAPRGIGVAWERLASGMTIPKRDHLFPVFEEENRRDVEAIARHVRAASEMH